MKYPYTYLRLSVTDRCNFDCFYCKPSARSQFFKNSELLDFKQILILAEKFVSFGIKHIRLTGGEPCLRKDLCVLAQNLSFLPGLENLSLTSNGFKLCSYLKKIKNSGVSRINISLDTLKRDRFKKITGKDAFYFVKKAVLDASVLGFKRIKVNVVVMRHVNDDEILDFVDFGNKHNIDVRFIEFFPVNGHCDTARDFFVSTSETKKKIESVLGYMVPLTSDFNCGPAQYYQIPGASCRIGFISSVSDFFCPGCNRLRLSANGSLYPCLHSDYHVDLKKPLLDNDVTMIERIIDKVASDKKLFNKAFCARAVEMSGIGG